METLVLHPGALGDIILSLPALERLREKFPDVRLTLAGNLDFLAPVSRIADRLVSLSVVPLHKLFSEVPLSDEELAYWRSFDRVLSWTGSGNSLFERRLKEIHPSALVAGWKPEPCEQRHVSRIFLDSMKPWIGDAGESQLRPLVPCEDDLGHGQVWLHQNRADPGRPMIALHPGAGSRAKRWPLERYKEVAVTLTGQAPVQLLAIEGPAESGVGRQLADGLPAGRCLLARELPLGTLAAVLRSCRLFIGNDSGISHLAAALGVASVVLFGPTEPGLWAPVGKRVYILRNSIGCEACAGTAESSHRCMENPTVSDVLDRLRRIGEIPGL